MKKSFLLYTVSGLLFCSHSSLSYALNATSPTQPTLTTPSMSSSYSLISMPSNGKMKEPEKKSNETEEKPLPLRPTAKTSDTDISTQNNQTKPEAKVKSRRRGNISHAASAIDTTNTETLPKNPESEQPLSTHINSEKKVLMLPMLAKPESVRPLEGKMQQSDKSVLAKNEKSIFVNNGTTVTKHNVDIYDKFFAVSAIGKNSTINILGGKIDSNFVAINANDSGIVNATGITATAGSTALLTMNATINIKDSLLNVISERNAHGILFLELLDVPKEKHAPTKVELVNTKLFVPEGIGIYGNLASGEVNLKNSAIYADLLIKNEYNENKPAYITTLNAENSILEGRVRTSGENKTIFNLKDNTKWLLKPNKNTLNNDRDSSEYASFGVDEKSYSKLSALNVTDSNIVFAAPTEGLYQTLYIGNKAHDASTVYNAQGATKIYLNTTWNGNSPILQQETDRVLIAGNVSGTTIVHIDLFKKDKKIKDSVFAWEKDMASLPSGTHGVSVIQVYGQANEDSFKLAGGYMTMGGLPYKYVLAAYAPGKSHASQNLFAKNSNDFWDFRFQNAYVDKDEKVRALLPQVANYFVMPNALFSAGFTDVSNQNTLLDNMRTAAFGIEDNKQKNIKKNAIFASSYGEKITLSSERDPLQYGYGADVNYNAVQLGIVLAMLESKDISTHFGLLGTYGKLSFTPKDMKDSEKTTLNKWMITAYSGIQHNSGLYVNTLLSYGILKGNITTALVGNAAKLDGTEILNTSATIGHKLATGVKGLVFEPQVQVIYQNLISDVISDADGFEVNMNNPHQWLVRIGGRLTQTTTTTKEGDTISFYGKLNIIKTLDDDGTIQIGDTFHLDPTSSSIEGGVGINAYLSQNITLHGGVSYRQKLQKAGVSGTNFSGGIRYQF
ncbi:autotransporter outer membrane beta-barrel domain-containing protein [Bartonella doshiae]|uniref:Type V secretory pathway, adhesin AidA n=2 Tax=Bartonella doshiae TaxID=33044 RepID=A0A380ZGF3_BARDO|nr:autotransporter outer membrane beta-barrel domain-containing protein [Bartonella doshiae]EJF79008.1 outer membrane autotransporter barrel domain-containing protein [Bartonella doshiae NCTC 12862 = ATCC 700133]MBB6159908.1 outer membrane autotransporter protein [Bartonella doshiae]SUV45414.1 Type V secretory pathway, adhesin AidA [Bartonella doshiae]